ncbi:DUF4832 domain-containing protein [Herpetosiphon sp. NSE202]|uniref:DUF4832 domain-containing protein n=1 Tax=Herpetosiphon sp. NSE202 TaxID=3351349 RepID=UPI0036422526
MRTVKVLIGLLVMAGLGVVWYVLRPQPNTDWQTFTPTIIPIEQAELANPGRGLYQWRGQTMICPANLISNRERYDRWTWAALEPSENQYNWQPIHQLLDNAEVQGQRVWLGLGASAGPSSNGPFMPEYLQQAEFGASFEGDWYPNYNHHYVQTRLEALLDEFVAEFAGDQRILGVQMRSYGRYGEGYLPWNADKSHGMWASDTTARWLVDAWHTRLSQHFLISIPLSNNPVFYYAMTKQPYWSITRDALGMPEQMRNIDQLIQSDITVDGMAIGPLVAERWKVAPIFSEMIGEYGEHDYSGQFLAAQTQVISYHISYVSNGNFAQPYREGPWDFWRDPVNCPEQASNWTQADIHNFGLAGKLAGYRYAPSSIKLAVRDQQLHIESTWQNAGVAPIYERWPLVWQVRDHAQTLVWQAEASLDLRQVLPNQAFVHTQQFAQFSLPAGDYELSIVAPAINRYVQPLQLAIDGKQDDGRYRIGILSIR